MIEHSWYARLRALIAEREARELAGDDYARWANREHAAGLRVGGISRRDRIRLAIAVLRLP